MDLKTEEEFRRILLEEWDPLRIGGITNSRDEYDDYVFEVFNLLVNGATSTEIANYLGSVEERYLSTSPNLQILGDVAENLYFVFSKNKPTSKS